MQPQIFLSYSWKNKDIADAIDNDWQAVGLTLIRDVRDAKYKQNLKQFMQRVHESDYVLLLISKDYLESKNCMYEALEVFGNPDFKSKILPILTKDAQISDTLIRLAYIEYWDAKQQKLNDSLKRMASSPIRAASIIEDLRQLAKIGDSIDAFASEIKDMLCASWPTVQKEGYAIIFDHIGFNGDQRGILEECARIIFMDNEEDQELALEKLKADNSSSAFISYTESTVAYRAKKYKKARKIIEELIINYPTFYIAYNSLAYLLEDKLQDYEGARQYYERGLAINPNYDALHRGLGSLLEDHFQDYEGARQHYERALAISPDSSDNHYSMALLMGKNFNDYTKSRYHFERSLALNAEDSATHYNYAYLLANYLNEPTSAKYHYEQAVRIEPTYAAAHNNLAIIAQDEGDYDKMRYYLEQALAADSSNAQANHNYGKLMWDHYRDYPKARQYFEAELATQPDNASTHESLAHLLALHSEEFDLARQHYEQALALAPASVTTHCSTPQ